MSAELSPHLRRYDAVNMKLLEARSVLTALIVDDHGENLNWDVTVSVLSAVESLLDSAKSEADGWLEDARGQARKAVG